MLKSSAARITLLALLICVFSLYAAFTYERHMRFSHSLIANLKSGSWSASELDRELDKFLHTLALFRFDQTSVDDVQLRFDLLWSRLDMLLIGEETVEVRGLPGIPDLLSRFEQAMLASERDILDLQPGDASTAKQLESTFRTFEFDVRDFSVRAFNGPARMESLAKEKLQQQQFGYYLLGLLGIGFVLLLIVLRESLRGRHLALHDALTDLSNRTHLNDLLTVAEKRFKRDKVGFSVHVLDINDFKNINDTLGYQVGDKLLVEIARRLTSSVREQDVVARLGGDEFAILQTDIEGVDSCSQLARRICDQLTQPFALGEHNLYLTASVGISLFPEDAESANQVLANADIAMTRAKKDSGSSYRFFEHEMNDALSRQKHLSDDLRGAISNNELVLFYQPVVNLSNGCIESVEALLRWHHESYGYIPPHEIVALADQFAMTKALNDWVLTQACIQNRQWHALGIKDLNVNVNISAAMYTQHDVVESVRSVLALTNMTPENLVLEITEDTTMRDIDASPDIMRDLRELGVKLALDDFGTGYSSLGHLRRIPVDTLKIDKSFVQDLNNVPKDFRFIRTIIQLATTLDVKVVAEGIALDENLRDLIGEGCQYGQGYLFSRPRPAWEIMQLLEQQLQGQHAFAMLIEAQGAPVQGFRSA